MLLLNVQHGELLKASKLGAVYNYDIESWVSTDVPQYHNFVEFLPEFTKHIICDHVYLIEKKHPCTKCGKETTMVWIAVDNYIDIFYDDDKNDYSCIPHKDKLYSCSVCSPLPHDIIEYVENHYNAKYVHSHMHHCSDIINYCENCKGTQKNHVLRVSENSPFNIETAEDVDKLTVYKVPLKYDFSIRKLHKIESGMLDLIQKKAIVIDLEKENMKTINL